MLPTITVTGGTVEENESFTPTTTVDTGTAGSSYTYSVDWGDGSQATYGTSDIPSHVYVDDNPTDTPSDNYTFTVTATWSNGPSATATGTVTVTNVAPTAKNDPATDPILANIAGSFQTDEDTPFLTGNVLVNDEDQSPADTLHVVSIDTTGTEGTVTINGSGTFQYDPNGKFDYLIKNEVATDTFIYTIADDDDPLATSSATVTITVTGKPERYNLSFTTGAAAKEENQTVATVTLSLDKPAPSGGLTVSWRPWAEVGSGDDIADSSDLANPSGSATFAEGSTQTTFELTPVDDSNVERNERFYFEIPWVSNDAIIVTSNPSVGSIRILDNEWRWSSPLSPAISHSINELFADERGNWPVGSYMYDQMIAEIYAAPKITNGVANQIHAEVAAHYLDRDGLVIPDTTDYTLHRYLDLAFSLNAQTGQITQAVGSVYSGDGTQNGELTIVLMYDGLEFDNTSPLVHTVRVKILSDVAVGGTFSTSIGGGEGIEIGFEKTQEWGRRFGPWEDGVQLRATQGEEE